MILKYNIEIEAKDIINRLKQLINLIYKLLPMREENENWEILLSTIIEELAGMARLLPEIFKENLFILVSKLEGLFTLNAPDDFFDFRRTVFECLNLLNKVKENVSNN